MKAVLPPSPREHPDLMPAADRDPHFGPVRIQEVIVRDMLVEPTRAAAVRGESVLGHVRLDAGGDVLVGRADHVRCHAVRVHDRPALVDESLSVAELR